MLFETMPATLGQIGAGKMRPLATTADRRSVALPQVPTFAEAGLPKMQMTTWYGAFVRAGTPASVTQPIAALIAEALLTPNLQTAWREAGMTAAPYLSGAKFSEFVNAEQHRWVQLVNETGARIEE